VRRTLLPSAEIEKEIGALLQGGLADVRPLEVASELGRLGVRLVLQRAVEEEVDDWLGQARYERRPEAAPASGTATGRGVSRPPRARSWSGCRRCARPARRSRASSSAGAGASSPASRSRRS
jgi:hypothetical protein